MAPGKNIVFLSGKGGVGKTNLVANVGLALCERGANVLLIDANLSCGNLAYLFGPPFAATRLNDVLRGAPREKAIFPHPTGIRMVQSSMNLDLFANNLSLLPKHLHAYSRYADFVLIDSPGTLGINTLKAIEGSDGAFIVSNSEITAQADALKTKNACIQLKKPVHGLILNRIEPYDRKDVSNLQEWIELPLLGTIPEDNNVRKAVMIAKPALLYAPRSPFSQGVREVAARLLGVPYQRPVEGVLERLSHFFKSKII